jgi:hypothetical protein
VGEQIVGTVVVVVDVVVDAVVDMVVDAARFVVHPVHLPFAARGLPRSPARPVEHPPRQRGDARSGHLLPAPRDGGNEDQQPEHDQAREDHRARHGCLLPLPRGAVRGDPASPAKIAPARQR